jgi:hypothetical protein
MMIIIIIIIIQFNSYLLTWKFNSTKANYNVSTSKKNETTTEHNQNLKRCCLYNNNVIHLILYYLCVESRATRPITDTAYCR